MSINIKKYTKEQMAKMVEEAQEAQQAAACDADVLRETINDERQDTAEEIIALRKQLHDAKSELAKARVKLAAADAANDRKAQLLNALCDRAAKLTVARDAYHQAFRWCLDHPWRNLWRCIAWWFRAEPVKAKE